MQIFFSIAQNKVHVGFNGFLLNKSFMNAHLNSNVSISSRVNSCSFSSVKSGQLCPKKDAKSLNERGRYTRSFLFPRLPGSLSEKIFKSYAGNP